jgi:hypothetical protein
VVGFLLIIIPPQQKKIKLFWVVGWVVAICTEQQDTEKNKDASVMK